MSALPPATQPKSAATVYSLEAQYAAMETEYRGMVQRLETTCLGKTKATEACTKAAQLNADMQTTLGALSDAMQGQQFTDKSQQRKLLDLTDGLEQEYSRLTAESADASVIAGMYEAHYIAWLLGLVLVAGVVWKARR